MEDDDPAVADAPNVSLVLVADEPRHDHDVGMVSPEPQGRLRGQNAEVDLGANLLEQGAGLLSGEPDYRCPEEEGRFVHGAPSFSSLVNNARFEMESLA